MKTKPITEIRITKNKENTLALQCYEQLQDDIINGTFAPGQKLKMETLKQRLKVGQSPIREALSRLVASGLVENQGNKGFRVAQVSETNIRDIYRTFFQIELLALNQAMELGGDAWEASVAAALHHLALVETKLEPVSYQIWAQRNYAFHVALISGCNSPLLLHIRANLYLCFDRYCRIAFNISNSQLHLNHDEHKKLAEAVLERNTKKARELLQSHVFGALEDVIKTLKKSNLL